MLNNGGRTRLKLNSMTILNKMNCFNTLKLLTKYQIAALSSLAMHKNKSHHHEKTYIRIWPAAKNLMKIHNIKEEDLPRELKVVMKEHIIDLVNKIKLKKHYLEGKTDSVSVIDSKIQKNQKTHSINSYIILDDLHTYKDSFIDWVAIKQKLPHSYFNNIVAVDNLNTYINEINQKHKKSIKLADFFAKVTL